MLVAAEASHAGPAAVPQATAVPSCQARSNAARTPASNPPSHESGRNPYGSRPELYRRRLGDVGQPPFRLSMRAVMSEVLRRLEPVPAHAAQVGVKSAPAKSA